MDKALREDIAAWLASVGVDYAPTDGVSTLVLITASFIVAFITHHLFKRGVVNTMNLVIHRTKASWDDSFVKYRVLEKFALLVPILLLALLIPLSLTNHTFLSSISGRILGVGVVMVLTRAIYSVLDATNDIADHNLVSRRLPIKSFVQLCKLFLFFVAVITSISILAEQSPIYFLSGLGVITGLVMLVFRDTILGFVAGIQLAANRMVSTGDWIQMDKYGADGEVEEVSLNTVKVRNWDKTITMIPAYALVSDSFKNWRGMSESGGRRIKRSVIIDIHSIAFIDEFQLQKLAKINLLKEYLSNKQQELAHFNSHLVNSEELVNSRTLTNIGTFRAYLLAYLREHQQIRSDMTLLVRQLSATSEGVPLELYLFTNDTRWAQYEDIQGDIFDHIFAILPEFGLRAYQAPTGSDIRSLTRVNN